MDIPSNNFQSTKYKTCTSDNKTIYTSVALKLPSLISLICTNADVGKHPHLIVLDYCSFDGGISLMNTR